jgi:alpha-galactosidase
MGAHVSAVPNHQTGRSVSLKMRGDVALSGNFGFELDLAALDPTQLEEAKAIVSRVKSLRDLTLKGTFWRLLSPFERMHTAWSFVSEDQRQVLLCVFQVLCVPNTAPLRIRLRGLQPDAWYETEDGRRYLGAALMYQGLFCPLHGDYDSSVLLLRRI